MFKEKSKLRYGALFALLLIFSSGLFSYVRALKTDRTIYYVLAEEHMVETEPEEEVNETDQVLELREHYGNDEIRGKLIIPGTGISEPILKARDNSYYLDHNPYGEYQAEGSIYEDYRTSFGDKKVLIYGHSSPGWNVPFNELEKYYDKKFYDKHKYIKIIDENKTYKYEIFSVYVETSDFTYMNLKLDRPTYNSYLQNYKDRSFYDTGVEINDGDHILILQTCSNKREYAKYNKKFLLVIAKEIREV